MISDKVKSKINDDIFVRIAPVSGAEGNRVVRVFVSSTFLDMHAERDVLVKFVFPELNKLCSDRNVEFSFVDLRWGITEEQVAKGEVLPICLAEIEHCRPYFIGLLAQYYGSLAKQIPPEIISQYTWLSTAINRSVTEIEMLRVLNDPTIFSRAFFYLRSAIFLEHQEEVIRKKWTSSGVAAQHLDLLRKRIIESGIQTTEYSSPEILGEIVLKQLWAAIDAEFPLIKSEDDKLEAQRHHAHAKQYNRVYIGQKSLFDNLTAHVLGDSPPLVITGEVGSGKSALVENWLIERQNEIDDIPTLLHVVGATPDSDQWMMMLARIIRTLGQNLSINYKIPSEPDKLLLTFQRFLHEIGGRSRVLLVIDNADRLQGPAGIPSWCWLPLELPYNVRFIVTARQGRALNEMMNRGWSVLTIEPISPLQKRVLVEAYLKRVGRCLGQDDMEKIISSQCTQMPLFLILLLQELCAFGQYAQLSDKIRYYLEANSLDELYAKVFQRWEEDYGRDMVSMSLTLIHTSRYGLPEQDLRMLLDQNGLPIASAHWSPFFLSAELEISPRPGLLFLRNENIANAVTKLYCTPDRQHAARQMIIEYYQSLISLYVGFTLVGGVEERYPQILQAVNQVEDYISENRQRAFRELPWQFIKEQRWEALYDLISTNEFTRWAFIHARSDILSYWSQLKMHGYRASSAYYSEIEAADFSTAKYLEEIAGLIGKVGEVDEALTILKKLEDVYRRQGDRTSLGITLLKCAVQQMRWGDLADALETLNEAESVFYLEQNSLGLAEALADKGVILYDLGDLVNAVPYLEKAMKIFQSCEDLPWLGIVYNGLGSMLLTQMEYSKGLDYLRRAETIFRQTGNLDELGRTLSNEALAFSIMGRKEQARKCRFEAIQLFQESENESEIKRVQEQELNLKGLRLLIRRLFYKVLGN